MKSWRKQILKKYQNGVIEVGFVSTIDFFKPLPLVGVAFFIAGGLVGIVGWVF